MKKIFTLVLTFATVLGASAQTVSQKVAAQKAASLFAKSSAAKGAQVSTTEEPQLVYTSELNGTTCFYAFNNPEGGYAIIGGDAVAKEVLGVVDNGSFDYDKAPAGLKYMLNRYAQQIAAAKAAGLSAPKATAQAASISKLCPATWGQGAPYSNLTPILPDIAYYQNYQGDSYAGQHAATGCVATAAAQALYTLYKQGKTMPAHVKEDISKKLSFNTEDDKELQKTDVITYSKDRDITWSILRDSYEETDNDASAEEVAQLMKLMGLVSDMGYGISSGAGTTNLQEGLKTNLDIDAKYLSEYDEDGKIAVDEETWESTVYNELKENRPVVYTGNAADGNGGHCYLCDGYSKDNNLFHFNWGWDNAGDGFFALYAASVTAQSGEGSLMKPETGGSQTGGQGDKSTYDFSCGNEIVYNLIYTGSDPYTPTAIATVNDDVNVSKSVKAIVNGKLLIMKGNQKFNIVGQKM